MSQSSAEIDPGSIKLIAAFWIGMSLDDQDPLKGIFPAFGAMNKELAAHLLDHKDLLTRINFIGGALADPSEAETIPANLLEQIPDIDVYDQTGMGTLMDQSGTLCVFTCVPGTGSTHVLKGPLLPKVS